jgi:predicted NBD/HSP70 family sugar kinase
LHIRTADRRLIRDTNVLAIFNTLRRDGPTTRAALARKAGLSGPTVSTVIQALEAGGIVASVGAGPETGGRRGYMIDLVPSARMLGGVDLNASNPLFALLDLGGQIAPGSLREVPSAALASPQQLVSWLESVIGQAPLLGMGIAVPGVTDSERGIVDWAPSLDWRNVELGGAISSRLPMHLVVIDNDLNLSALGEFARAPDELGDMAMVGLRGGLGAGIVLGGHVYRGTHFAAGEIGYVVPGLRELQHEDVQFGSLETAIVTHRSGRRRVTELLALACIALSAVLDIGTIVLSEEIVNLGHDVQLQIVEYLERHVPHPPRVVSSQLGGHAALHGAAHAVLNRLGVRLSRLLTVDDDLSGARTSVSQ